MQEKPNPSPSVGGDQSAQPSQFLPVVYDELREAAHRMMSREADGHTLQPTSLVHEAYLRVSKSESKPQWANVSHFSAVIVESMRRILVESARRKKRLKRGGGMNRRDIDPGVIEAPGEDDALLALDEALTALATVNTNWAELVKLRYFLGMSVPEAAKTLGVSPRTADAWWASARTWLKNKVALDVGEMIPEAG